MATTRYIDSSYGIPGFNKPTKQTVEDINGIREVEPIASFRQTDLATNPKPSYSGIPASASRGALNQTFLPVQPSYAPNQNASQPMGLSQIFSGQNLAMLFPFLASMFSGFGGGNPPKEAKPDLTAKGGAFTDFSNDLNAEIDKYVGELRGEARGDYDFAIKWLTANHELALGKNDKARAEFFEKVADKLEEQIGRIPYDYFQKTDREKKDLLDFLKAQNRESEDLIARQKEFSKQQEFATGIEKDQTNQEFNSRGLLDSGIQKKQEAQQAQKRQLFETDPFNRRAMLEADQRTFETGRGVEGSQRRLQDITTGARRAGIDENTQFTFGNEKEKRSLEQRLAEIARMESASRRSASQEAQQFAFLQ